MRTIRAQEVSELVERLVLEAAFRLGGRELAALERAREEETSPRGRSVLSALLENARLAAAERLPLCQDCGLAVVWVERGEETVLAGGGLAAAVDEGVRRAYLKGYLRKSVLRGALDRRNTGDNTPAFLRVECVPGEVFRVHVALKGGGAENTSALAMLVPAAGREGVVEFVLRVVREAAGRACPPLILGVGVGGNFEGAAWLAKKALFRPLGDPNPEPRLAALEREILERVNGLGIGPMGLGGRVTALAVHLEEGPCHLASLPVAVNVECHSHRHREGEL